MSFLPLLSLFLSIGCHQEANVILGEGAINGIVDLDGDGWDATLDCDDQHAAVHPGAPEYCNGSDDDCDGTTDEDDAEDAPAWAVDLDGDGFGALGEDTVVACLQPSGRVRDASDCDDTDPSIRPDAEEVCDGIDNDCSGAADEGLKTVFYRDGDGDGYGDPGSPSEACTLPDGYVENADDCDDADSHAFPGASWFQDQDGDGYGNAAWSVTSCLPPASYTWSTGDCDDEDAAVNPGADERCDDGVDNDCDGAVDDGRSVDAILWYQDADGDGYGDPSAAVPSCVPLSGYLLDATDCDDTDPDIHPSGVEACYDDADNNCDGALDEGCPEWHCPPSGVISADETWSSDEAHFIGCDITIEGSSSPTLTIEGGAMVYVGEGASLTVGGTQPGALVVDGDTLEPVVITSGVTKADPMRGPAAGDWEGITFNPRAVAEDSYLHDVEISHFGRGSSPGLSLSGAGGSIDLTRVVLTEGRNWGITVEDGAMPSIVGSEVSGVAGGGVYVDSTSGFSDFSLNSLVDNDEYPLEIPVGAIGMVDDSSAFSSLGAAYSYVVVDGGSVSSDLVVSPLDLPYYITSTITVTGASTEVELDDGVDLRFDDRAALSVTAGGSLFSNGAGPGVSLSAFDPSSWWLGITLNATAGSVELTRTTLSRAGDNGYGAIYIVSTVSPVLESCTITDSSSSGLYVGASSTPVLRENTFSGNSDYGIYLTGSAGLGEFTSNVVTDNDGYPMGVPPSAVDELEGDNAFSGNAQDYVEVQAGTVSATATWHALDVPYLLLGSELEVAGTSYPVLTLEAGTELEFPSGADFIVGSSSYGGLKTQGTDADPVAFRYHGSCTSRGQWGGITFGQYTYSAGTRLQGITVDCGGGNGEGNISIQNGVSAIQIDGCSLTQSTTSGLKSSSSSASLDVSDCTFSDNDDYGIYLYKGSINAFSTNVFADNGIAPLYLGVADVSKLDTASDYGDPDVSEIEVVGGAVATSATWKNLGVPLFVSSSVMVNGGATLTLDAGVTVEFGLGTMLQVGTGSTNMGGLIAWGTTDDPVTLTAHSSSPYAGYWVGVVAKTYCVSGAMNLQGVVVEYAGVPHASGANGAALYFSYCPASVSNSTIRYSSTNGVYCYGSPVTLTGMTYEYIGLSNTYGC